MAQFYLKRITTIITRICKFLLSNVPNKLSDSDRENICEESIFCESFGGSIIQLADCPLTTLGILRNCSWRDKLCRTEFFQEFNEGPSVESGPNSLTFLKNNIVFGNNFESSLHYIISFKN